MRSWLASAVLLASVAAPAHGLGGDGPRLWWLIGVTCVLAAIATLASLVLVLQQHLEEARAGEAPESGGTLEGTSAHERRLAEVAQRLAGELRQGAADLAGQLGQDLRHQARALNTGLGGDRSPGVAAAPGHRLEREIAALAGSERRRLAAGLEAAGQLGDWIDRLWPVLESAAGRGTSAIAAGLSPAAAGEWRSAEQALRGFCRLDTAALRRLGRRIASAGNGTGTGSGLEGAPAGGLGCPERSAPEAAVPNGGFLESAGLLAGERPLTERLRRYLEPFDHLGRLGEVILALQYLLEAYPVEQLPRDRRSRLRRELAATLRRAGLEPDFHRLVTRIAAGVGLRYRPVRYYRSRTDQSEYAFVRQQVSPISLSARVGFDATTEREVIVRLERPFFAQMSTDIYHAGHACVARG